MKKYSSLLALPLCCGLMVAQEPAQTPAQTGRSTPAETSRDSGQTISGILVASSCSTSNMPKSTASSMHSNTPASSATPPMMRTTPLSSTDRESKNMDRGTVTDRAAAMNRDRARDVNQGTGTDSQLERTRTMDQTSGTADRRGTPLDTQAGNNMSDTDSSNWDRSCFIGTKTSEFALQTTDGRVLRFDGDANSQIRSKLDSSSRVATKNKIFRVRVTGSVEGDTVHLTDIVL